MTDPRLPETPLAARVQENLNKTRSEYRSFLESRRTENRWTNADDDISREYEENIEALEARVGELQELEAANARAVARRDASDALPSARAEAGMWVTGTETHDQQVREENRAVDAMFAGETNAVDLTFENRDLTVGTSTAGGDLVPTDFRRVLIDAIRHESTFLDLPNVLFIDTGTDGNTLDLPKITSHGTATWTAEGSALTEADPAYAKVSLGAYKAAQFIEASSELEFDNRVNFRSHIANELGRSVGYLAGNGYAVGNGSDKPTGLFYSAGTAVSGTATAGIQADEIVDMYYALDPSLQSRGVWVASATQAKQIRKLTDGDGRFMIDVSAGLEYGAPAQMLGRPFFVSPHAAALGSANASLAFFDPSYFAIRGTKVRVERSVDYAFNRDMVAWRGVFRTDSKLVNTDAAKVYVGT